MKKQLDKSKRLTKVALLIILIILGWLVFEVIIRGFDVVSQEYGINPKTFITILIICEIFFNIGIILMIMGSGALKLRLKHIFNLDFQDVIFENKLVYTGFTVNRLSAIIPPVYLLLFGWKKLPVVVTTLIIIELFIVIVIATLPFEIKRFKLKTNENNH